MPDDNGKLTQVEMEDFQKWATKTFPNGMLCPLCRSNQWHKDIRLTTPIVLGKSVKRLDRELPSVTMVCESCGNVAHLNATILRASCDVTR